jgi:archaellum biogenesis ATPase FlaH
LARGFTGKLSLTEPLKELRKITQPHQPILLTIMAEEVKTGVHEPLAMSSTVLLALIMAELDNTPPYFDSDK